MGLPAMGAKSHFPISQQLWSNCLYIISMICVDIMSEFINIISGFLLKLNPERQEFDILTFIKQDWRFLKNSVVNNVSQYLMSLLQ